MNFILGARATQASLRVVLATILSAIAACGPTNITPIQSYNGARLPRPDVVIVTDFLASPDEVRVDRGIGARLRNTISGTPVSVQQSEDDRRVTAKIAKVLVEEIGNLGLPAVQSNDPTARTGVGKLIVGGEVLSIDEGNRTRRNLIGLGAGKSDVQARVDLYYSTNAGEPRFIESFAADAESSRRPGAAETMGVGAAIGRAVETSAVGAGAAVANKGDVEADSERMAKAIARQLAGFFVAQGWIPEASAR